MTDEPTPAKSQEDIENAVRAAVADDLESLYGDPVVVLDYHVIARVLNHEGEVELQTTQATEALASETWGWVQWAADNLKHAMNRNRDAWYDQ